MTTLKCILFGHDWVNWECDQRFCHRCPIEQIWDNIREKWITKKRIK